MVEIVALELISWQLVMTSTLLRMVGNSFTSYYSVSTNGHGASHDSSHTQ